MLIAITGEVSVNPYPSSTEIPTEANQFPVSTPSGAPPEMNVVIRPPNASRIFAIHQLFRHLPEQRAWPLSIVNQLSVATLPGSTAQARIRAFIGDSGGLLLHSLANLLVHPRHANENRRPHLL